MKQWVLSPFCHFFAIFFEKATCVCFASVSQLILIGQACDWNQHATSFKSISDLFLVWFWVSNKLGTHCTRMKTFIVPIKRLIHFQRRRQWQNPARQGKGYFDYHEDVSGPAKRLFWFSRGIVCTPGWRLFGFLRGSVFSIQEQCFSFITKQLLVSTPLSHQTHLTKHEWTIQTEWRQMFIKFQCQQWGCFKLEQQRHIQSAVTSGDCAESHPIERWCKCFEAIKFTHMDIHTTHQISTQIKLQSFDAGQDHANWLDRSSFEKGT